jgi:uncharacterized protein (TIGR02266 family)
MAVAITDDPPRDGADDRKRRLGRADILVPVQLWRQDQSRVPGVTRNLSIGGMFVATPRALPVGTRLAIRFSILDEAEPVEIEAEVRWSRRVAEGDEQPVGLGLAFLGSLARAALFVHVLLRSNAPSWI